MAEALTLQFGIGRHYSARPALAASRWLCPGRAEIVRIVPETVSDEGRIITFVVAIGSVRLVRRGECPQMRAFGVILICRGPGSLIYAKMDLRLYRPWTEVLDGGWKFRGLSRRTEEGLNLRCAVWTTVIPIWRRL